MADKMAVNLPPDQRDQFKKLMTSQLDIAAFNQSDDRLNGEAFYH
jgi:hypothetical protein